MKCQPSQNNSTPTRTTFVWHVKKLPPLNSRIFSKSHPLTSEWWPARFFLSLSVSLIGWTNTLSILNYTYPLFQWTKYKRVLKGCGREKTTDGVEHMVLSFIHQLRLSVWSVYDLRVLAVFPWSFVCGTVKIVGAKTE